MKVKRLVLGLGYAMLALASPGLLALDKVAPNQGKQLFMSYRLGEAGHMGEWYEDGETARLVGLQDYLFSGTYCSYMLTNDGGWNSPAYFYNSGIETWNYKNQQYEFVHSVINGCVSRFVDGLNNVRKRDVACPDGYGWDSTEKACLEVAPFKPDKNNDKCPAGENGSNPVHTALGTKLEHEADITIPGSRLSFERYYTSATHWAPGSLGKQWRHNFERRVTFSATPTRSTAYVTRENGNVFYFDRLGDGSFAGDADVREQLSASYGKGGVVIGWTLKAADDSTESYDSAGRLIGVAWPDGQRLTLAYANGLLGTVTDEHNRSLTFEYYTDYPAAGTMNLISRVVGPGGSGVNFIYQAAGSQHVIQSRIDENDGERVYVYGEGGADARLLTGIVNENGDRYASWRYDSQGRATLSVHGDASSYVDRVELSYSGNVTTNPATATTTVKQWINGVTGTYEQRIYGFAMTNGVLKTASVSGPCSSCGGDLQSLTYDVNGYVDKRTDFNGTTTDTDYAALDAGGRPRGLETRRVEAFSRGVLTDLPERRTYDTAWHATFRKPVERTLTNRSGLVEAREQWAYNSRGQVAAYCESDPSDAAASAYACSATTAPPAGARVTRRVYAYCEAADVAAPAANCPVLGYLKSVNGPRAASDAGMGGIDDITTYAYRSADDTGCSTAGVCNYRKGDLWKIVNALGQVTEYQIYQPDGQPARVVDPNGTITAFTYGAKGWLESKRIYARATPVADARDAVTRFEHDAVGNVTRMVLPDGSYQHYVYDDARRLIEVENNLGERLVYTLDSLGNRIREATFDATYDPGLPNQGLKRSLSGIYNQLGRLTQVLDANNAITYDSASFDAGGLSDGYDAVGNLVQFADGLGVVTRRQYDPLNRLVATIRDYLGPDPATSDTTSGFIYDARDKVRSVVDPGGLTTSYTYDGFGNTTALDSPDTGHTAFAYDLAGNAVSRTDNRGVTAGYTYDPLNRLTAIGFTASAYNVAFIYDQANGVTGCAGSYPLGRLTRMTDASGSTTYCYDRRGNVTRKVQVTSAGTFSLDYEYTNYDAVSSITYPDGSAVAYTRDAAGRVTGMTQKATPASTPVPLVSDASYLPFGPLRQLTFGNGRTLSKNYDANYAIDSVVSSAASGLKLDFGTDVRGNIVSGSATIGGATPTRKYVYDRLGRLTRVDDGSNAAQESYAYDKTGNRLSKQFAGQAAQVYAYLSGTHRLASVGGNARSYDANGNTLSRGGDGVTLAYDPRNRLSGLLVDDGGSTSGTEAAGKSLLSGGVSYAYNGRGERVTKLDGSLIAPTQYIYDEEGRLLYESAGGFSYHTYLYFDGVPVVQQTALASSYLETDHLGTPRLAADMTTNAVQWAWDFFGSAFGEHAPVAAGFTSTDLALRYPGQYFDAESGLHYNMNRDYEPGTGRYIESDPIGLRGGTSTYRYAYADPLTFVDPTGLASCMRMVSFRGLPYERFAGSEELSGRWELNNVHVEPYPTASAPRWFPPLAIVSGATAGPIVDCWAKYVVTSKDKYETFQDTHFVDVCHDCDDYFTVDAGSVTSKIGSREKIRRSIEKTANTRFKSWFAELDCLKWLATLQ